MNKYFMCKCNTNLDEYQRVDWPEAFVTVPRVGDFVESLCGKKLRVTMITHRVVKSSGERYPYIEIELHR